MNERISFPSDLVPPGAERISQPLYAERIVRSHQIGCVKGAECRKGDIFPQAPAWIISGVAGDEEKWRDSGDPPLDGQFNRLLYQGQSITKRGLRPAPKFGLRGRSLFWGVGGVWSTNGMDYAVLSGEVLNRHIVWMDNDGIIICAN